MPTKLDSAIVRELVEIGTTHDPLTLVLVTYVAAAFHASLFGGMRAFMAPHQERVRELVNGPPSNATLTSADVKNVLKVSHHLELVYRLAVFDSFVNNLTSYALAARPSKATGSAQIKASVLLGKTRAQVVNRYIARRTKSLSRESFGARIQALKEITETDFALRQLDLDNLKRLSDLRNAIIHEGSAYQFTVDEDMHIHFQAESQRVTMAVNENFDAINTVAAMIYAKYVTGFLGREVNEPERTLIVALSPSS